MGGILNIGNTCYLASALQCIVSTDRVHRYIQETVQRDVVVDAYRDLHQQVRQNTGPVDPTRMYNIIKKHSSTFRDNEQNDAHEALIIILEILSKSFKNNIIERVFAMVTENVVYCEICNHETKRRETSYGLYHPVHTDKHRLTEYVCDCCERVNTSYHTSRVVRYPQTLIVLNPLVKTETFLFGDHVYETFAICNYKRFDNKSGHYNVFVRETERWIMKDDCAHKPVTDSFDNLVKDVSFILTRRTGRPADLQK